ncbi:hypothetical protein HanXRQr2_Chr02g0046851 [Helianthus annuus]|uniref:Uncharacterized protein n=1 Tax=Helianthus annuus TaxID=4232 RepID=A0A9K3JJT3_HELAN|nr:hypothetical protein HanXRQr2_Chr02g0046851 [Helianthus annuus]KAJ0950285.1 hypothetical protein HanPSC8_Chr02g0046441 [Helianthus annuus]
MRGGSYICGCNLEREERQTLSLWVQCLSEYMLRMKRDWVKHPLFIEML